MATANVQAPEPNREAGLRKEMAEIDLARTGPDTPGGRFMRKFWMAVGRSQDLPKGTAKPIRIMSVDYVMYRGESGRAQVIDYRCPHRGAQMHLGWVEGDDIRCIYHGWKFDCTGQCIEQPAEDSSFAAKVRTGSYPTREYMGLVFAYFGAGEAPHFPPFPGARPDALVDLWNVEEVPCNYLQCFENSMDEVHVAFVHLPGGSHSKIADLPVVGAEETDWGMLRTGTRANGKVRRSLHYMPNVTRVLVPPVAGMDGVGGWVEIFFNFTPIDDENHLWLITSNVSVSGKEAETYRAKRSKYHAKIAAARPAKDLALELMAGKHTYSQMQHPDLVIVQDIAVQAGQGRIADREHERLGRSDTAIILWRKILARELEAVAEGRPVKNWKPAPEQDLPTLGF
jgi:5,5'-dehydrodivanillate O-demethylase oxygenase subunit